MNLKLIAMPAVLAGLTVVAFTGCNKQEKLSQSTTPSYEPARVTVPSDAPIVVTDSTIMSPAAAARWDDLKKSAYEQQKDFSRDLKAMNAEFEARVSKLQSEYKEADATASRKAAMAELKNSQADFNQKMSAVGTATKDSWESARSDAAAAWDRLQAAYAKARAN